MARYAYDVNTRTRLIDVYKQFNGGLKTVDTDDALGSVYLRQAENVSLSEFGFIEKRYGTFQKDLIKTTSGTLQGYWEYLGFAIFVVDGVFYYKGTGDAVAIDKIYQESADSYAPNSIYGQDFRYPTVFGNPTTFNEVSGCEFTVTSTFFSQSDQTTPINQRDVCGEDEFLPKSNFTVCTINDENDPVPDGMSTPFYNCSVNTASNTTVAATVYNLNSLSFPQVDGVYRDMNAVNINNVLYIFTGKYPLYVKIVRNVPRFYIFPVTIPTYDEIVVTGHNLLEENFNEIYYKSKSDIQYTTPGTTTNYTTLTDDFDERPFFVVQKDSDDIEIKQHAPQIPFQNGGELDFNFKYVINPDYLEAYNSSSQNRVFILGIDNIGFRATGSGATTYTPIDADSIEFTKLHNYTGSGTLTGSFEAPYIGRDTVSFSTSINPPSTTEVAMFSRKLNVSGGELPTTAHQLDFEMDVNTEKNGYDFIAKENFSEGDTFEFRLLYETGLVNTPTAPLFIPADTDEIESTWFDNFTSLGTFSTSVGSVTSSWTTTNFTAPKITIIPVSETGTRFDAARVVIPIGEGLTRTTNGYRFTVPNNLNRQASVTGYHISLRGEWDTQFAYANGDDTDVVALPALSVFKELVKLEELESGTNFNLATTKNLGVKIKNLLSGAFDFRITYKLSKYTLDSNNFLNVTNDDDGDKFTEVIFYNIPITTEKLQDIPGIRSDFLPKLKPIWSCNRVIEHYGKLMVWGSTEMPTALFYSFPDRPTYFPSKFYLDFSNNNNQPIEAVTPYMNILVAQTDSQTWGIRGNSGLVNAPAPYVPFSINSTVGTIAPKSVRPVRNHLFFLSKQGVIALKSLYAADEQYNIEFVDRNIRNIVPQDSDAVGIQFDNQYWLNFPNNSITLRWYIDKKAWVKDVYQGWDDFKGVYKWQIAGGKLEYISYPSDIKEEATDTNKAIYKIGIDYALPTDLYQPIKAKFETSFLNQNYPFHPKNYKEAKLDFTLQNEYNKGRLAIFDSSVEGVTTTFAAQSISFTLGEGIKLEKNHRYRIDFFLNESTNSDGDFIYSPVNVTNIQIEGQTSYVHSFSNLDSNGNKVIATEFMLTNDEIATSGNIDLVFTHDSSSTANPSTGSYVSLRDVTYDDSLTFSTYIISEDRTLNFENFSGYDQATANIGVDLTAKERLGDWTFGTSDFGKKVTAVKTIKLSGKGYNSKLYLEDTSKSKWTLESMGITYKMKRARSR